MTTSKDSTQQALRALPGVDRVLASDPGRYLLEDHPRGAVTFMVRVCLEDARQAILDGSASGVELNDIVAQAGQRLQDCLAGGMRHVINATGIIIHTNLGRARLSEAAIEAVRHAARHAVDLEIDLESGRRSHRDAGVSTLLGGLTGAEAATIVNNNAAAVLLMLSALCRGGEVIVSRGELVEIGGSFRIPDVMAQSGARLVEVGTTNRTRLSDYEAAITPDTRALLRVHTSNYRIVGFTARPDIDELAQLAHSKGLLMLEDQGSGALVSTPALVDAGYPLVSDSVAAGVDVVTFSGDKLLGGPQAGYAVGEASCIQELRSHPLYRALRVDKLTLAAAQATLAASLDAGAACDSIPVLETLTRPCELVGAAAQCLLTALTGQRRWQPHWKAELVDTQSQVGGGALPGEDLASVGVSVSSPHDPERLARRLRCGDPAVLARVQRERLLFDMRTVTDDEVLMLAHAIGGALHDEEEGPA